jgi:hypothetical protein
MNDRVQFGLKLPCDVSTATEFPAKVREGCRSRIACTNTTGTLALNG